MSAAIWAHDVAESHLDRNLASKGCPAANQPANCRWQSDFASAALRTRGLRQMPRARRSPVRTCQRRRRRHPRARRGLAVIVRGLRAGIRRDADKVGGRRLPPSLPPYISLGASGLAGCGRRHRWRTAWDAAAVAVRIAIRIATAHAILIAAILSATIRIVAIRSSPGARVADIASFSTAGPGQAPSSGALGSSSSAAVAPDATKDLQCMLNGCQPQIDPQNPLVFFSDITPGGGAIVQGSGFGGAVGPQNALILTLTTYLHVPLTVKLENLTWVDNAVGGSIPADIRGVPDGPATLQLVTAAGALSDLINVNFVAARDVQLLDPNGENGYCSTNGTDNYCARSGTTISNISDLTDSCTQWNISGYIPPAGQVAGGRNAGL